MSFSQQRRMTHSGERLSLTPPKNTSFEAIVSSTNRYLYGLADERYIRDLHPPVKDVFKSGYLLKSYKFRLPAMLRKESYYDKDDLPILFKTSPECLKHLAGKVVNSIPMPDAYRWSVQDVCRWISRYGYPQYKETFRRNFVNGQRLVLCDANALSAMNIQHFDHIQHIAEGIRELFSYKMTKYGRCITLPPEYYYELYKLFRTKNGPSYDSKKRTELWEEYQLISKNKHEYDNHWQILERWLKMEKDPEFPVLIGGAPRTNLYRCQKQPKEVAPPPRPAKPCRCMPPCECRWTTRELRAPWRLSILPPIEYPMTRNDSILSVLQDEYPYRYGPVLKHEVP